MVFPAFNPPTLLPNALTSDLNSHPRSKSPRMNIIPNAFRSVATRRVLLAGALAATGAYFLRTTPPALGNAANKVTKTEEQWRVSLTPAQFRVLRESGTEWAFTSPLNKEYRDGTFHCAGCGNPLFSSSTKFDSGTGWPSFFQPLPSAVSYVQTMRDRMLLQKEVRCAKCDGHLGHVFEDGPKPTGLRFCMNGVALQFEPRP